MYILEQQTYMFDHEVILKPCMRRVMVPFCIVP